jgi:hypothetical protein
MGQIGILDEMMLGGSYKLLEVIATMCPNWLTIAESGGFLWTSERIFELGMGIGGRRKTRSVEGETRHVLFAGVRPCPFCAGNSLVLFVACCVVSLMFVGVAVQANAVQQCLRNA